MKYRFLLLDGSKEIPLFASNYKFKELGEESFIIGDGWNRRKNSHTWEGLYHDSFSVDISYANSYDRNSLSNYQTSDGLLIVGLRYVSVKIEDDIEILFLQTDKNIYISKNFKSYKFLWNKFKPFINKYLEGNEDVILTNNCGKNAFLQFEKPKFKSIEDRQIYCDSLLQEILVIKEDTMKKTLNQLGKATQIQEEVPEEPPF